jgi:Cation transporter/ATPase, N-terminus
MIEAPNKPPRISAGVSIAQAWHQLEVNAVLAKLETDATYGLDETVAAERLERDGCSRSNPVVKHLQAMKVQPGFHRFHARKRFWLEIRFARAGTNRSLCATYSSVVREV